MRRMTRESVENMTQAVLGMGVEPTTHPLRAAVVSFEVWTIVQWQRAFVHAEAAELVVAGLDSRVGGFEVRSSHRLP